MASSKQGSKKGSSGQSNTATAIEVGAGLAAVAAAAGAGYWFYADKESKKHRKAASKWAGDMKNQVVKEAKRLKDVDQKTMAAIVDRAAGMYSTARSVDINDLKLAASELKRNWKLVAADAQGVGRKAVGVAKSAKKATSNTAKTAKKSAKTVSKAASKTASKAKTAGKATSKKSGAKSR